MGLFEERRTNRKLVLDGLKSETGSSGGTAAASRVEAYRADPIHASTREFGYVGSLTLKRFYIDEGKPTANQRVSLWLHITSQMQKPTATDLGGWDSSTDVKQLQTIAEEST